MTRTHLLIIALAAVCASTGVQAQENAREYQTNCKAGDMAQCVLLGVNLQQGKSGIMNPVAANRLFKRACDGGEAAGCYQLGLSQENGIGARKDKTKAQGSMEKACTGGNESGCKWVANKEAERKERQRIEEERKEKERKEKEAEKKKRKASSADPLGFGSGPITYQVGSGGLGANYKNPSKSEKAAATEQKPEKAAPTEKPVPEIRLKMSPGDLDESCDATDIRNKVQERLSAIYQCYETALEKAPDLRGSITVEWTVGKKGKVTGSAVKTTTIQDTTVNACVKNRIRITRFNKPPKGTCKAAYSFSFKTKK